MEASPAAAVTRPLNQDTIATTMLRCNMRIASALALVLALPPGVARAGDWSPEQEAKMKQITWLRGLGGAPDQAITLAQQEFARTDVSKGYRRAVAREGKAAAIKVFEQNKATPRAAEAVAALCVAVDLMRTYQAELIESDADRIKIPPEVTRLEALATTAAAPCAPAPTPATAPAPPAPLLPIVAATPKIAAGPTSSPHDRLTRQRSRAAVGVGVGLVTVGVGLLAGMTAALAGSRAYDDKIANLRALGVQEHRDLTKPEMADITSWDARYVRLEKTGGVLGGFAALSVVTAIVVFVVSKRRPALQARLRLMGAGVRINF